MDRIRDHFAFGLQIPEPEFAVFEHPLDFFGRILGPEAQGFEWNSLVLLVKIVPGVKRRAESGSRVAGRWLHKHVGKPCLERCNQQRVKAPVHRQYRRFSAEPTIAAMASCRRACRLAASSPSSPAEAASPAEMPVSLKNLELNPPCVRRSVSKIAAINLRPHLSCRGAAACGTRPYRRFSGGRHPLHFVLVGPRFVAQHFRDTIEQIAERIGEIQFADRGKQAAVASKRTRGSKISRAIDAQNRCRAETRSVIGGSGVRGMMLHDHDLAVRKPGTQFELRSALRPRANGRAIATQSISEAPDSGRFERQIERFVGKRPGLSVPRHFACSTAEASRPCFNHTAAGIAEQSAQSDKYARHV